MDQSVTSSGVTKQSGDSLSSGSLDYSGSTSAASGAVSMNVVDTTQITPPPPGEPIDLGKKIQVNHGLIIIKTTNENGVLASEPADITGDEVFAWHVKGLGPTTMFIAAVNENGPYASIYADTTSGTLEAWPKVWMYDDGVKIEA